MNATLESITESNIDIDENIEDIFATYEQKFIKNDTWIKEELNLSKNTDFNEAGTEQADDLWQTTQTTNEIVHVVQDIINSMVANENRSDEDTPKDQTAEIVMTTIVHADESSNTKYKQHHNELSFGNNDLLSRQQKTNDGDGHSNMHNRITTEFFNDMSVVTEIISSPQALKGEPLNQSKDYSHFDNIPSATETIRPNDEIHDPADAFASILDADIREEFTKDIPGAHHKPSYAEEEMLEYSPLKDSAFVVKAEQIDSIPSATDLKVVSTNSTDAPH